MPRRLALPLITATALAIAGCGGSSTLSTSQYENQGVKALNPLLGSLNSLKSNPTDPARWAKLQTASQSASNAFSKLKPPSSLSSLNSQVVSSLSAMGAAAGKLGTDISKRNVAAARTDLNGYQAALQRYGSAITQLGSRGVKFLAR